MQCNVCFEKEPVIYFDCYCVFCLECFESKIRSKYEKMADNKFAKEPQTCQFCGISTQYKKCDRRNPNELKTIEQMEIKPERATIKAVECTKFNLLQRAKKIAFLERKVDFLTSVVHLFINKHKIVKFDFPKEIIDKDEFRFIEKLHSQYNSFSFDSVQTMGVKQTGKMDMEPQHGFINYNQSFARPNLVPGLSTIGFSQQQKQLKESNQVSWKADTQNYANLTTQQKQVGNQSIDYSQESMSETHSSKSIMGIKFQAIKHNSNLRDGSAKNSNRNNKNRLQTMIMQGTNLQNQFTTRPFNRPNY